MSPGEQRELVAAINQRNAEQQQRVDAAVHRSIAAAALLAALGFTLWALWTTGALVDAQALAALALLPLAGTRPLRRWLLRLPRRAHLWLRATYLRVRIAAAEIDMEALAELETAPEQIALHKACIDVWRVQLTDCELAARAE